MQKLSIGDAEQSEMNCNIMYKSLKFLWGIKGSITQIQWVLNKLGIHLLQAVPKYPPDLKN